jgi:hypothetical protein
MAMERCVLADAALDPRPKFDIRKLQVWRMGKLMGWRMVVA